MATLRRRICVTGAGHAGPGCLPVSGQWAGAHWQLKTPVGSRNVVTSTRSSRTDAANVRTSVVSSATADCSACRLALLGDASESPVAVATAAGSGGSKHLKEEGESYPPGLTHRRYAGRQHPHHEEEQRAGDRHPR